MSDPYVKPSHHKKPKSAKFDKRRAELKDIFKQTKHIAAKSGEGLDPKVTDDMIRNTLAYHTRKNGNLLELRSGREIARPSSTKVTEVKTQYEIDHLDSFVVARGLIATGHKPLVLNMANRGAIGGGVEAGARAQEETLFRCSNLHEALYPHGKPIRKSHAGRWRYKFPIEEFGSYYSPNVQVFRDCRSPNYNCIKPVRVAVISVAGYNLGKPHKLEKNLKGLSGEALNSEFKRLTKIKIEHILEVAILKGHDSLVLGAISCGAFKLPGDTTGVTARLVAEAYREVLEQPNYQNRFRVVTFAVLPEGPTGKINYEVFREMVTKLSNSLSSSASAASSSAAAAAPALPPSSAAASAQPAPASLGASGSPGGIGPLRFSGSASASADRGDAKSSAGSASGHGHASHGHRHHHGHHGHHDHHGHPHGHHHSHHSHRGRRH